MWLLRPQQQQGSIFQQDPAYATKRPRSTYQPQTLPTTTLNDIT